MSDHRAAGALSEAMKQVSRGRALRGKDDPWNGMHIQEGKDRNGKEQKVLKTKTDTKDARRES